jgi:hypothetical protein
MSPHGVRDANEAAVLPAERFATPVMIPGSFEIRARPRFARPIQSPAVPVADDPSTAVAFDHHARLEHEREGGGAPAERAGPRLGTIGARLWRRFRR